MAAGPDRKTSRGTYRLRAPRARPLARDSHEPSPIFAAQRRQRREGLELAPPRAGGAAPAAAPAERRAGLARIGGQRQRQRLDRHQPEVDAVAERLDLVVLVGRRPPPRPARGAACRQAGAAHRLVDAGGHRVERDDAGLDHRRAEPAVELPAAAAAAASAARRSAACAPPARRAAGPAPPPRPAVGRDVEVERVEVAELPQLDHAGELGIVGGVGDELGHRSSLGAGAACGAGPSSLNLDHAGSRGAREFGERRGEAHAPEIAALRRGCADPLRAVSRRPARRRCRCTATCRPPADIARIRPGLRRHRHASRRSSAGRRRTASCAIRPGTTCRARSRTTPTTPPRVVDRTVLAVNFDQSGVVRDIERYGLEDGRIVNLDDPHHRDRRPRARACSSSCSATC